MIFLLILYDSYEFAIIKTYREIFVGQEAFRNAKSLQTHESESTFYNLLRWFAYLLKSERHWSDAHACSKTLSWFGISTVPRVSIYFASS